MIYFHSPQQIQSMQFSRFYFDENPLNSFLKLSSLLAASSRKLQLHPSESLDAAQVVMVVV